MTAVEQPPSDDVGNGESASRRWQRLTRQRLEALAVLAADGDGADPTFWDDRAELYARRMVGTVADDPLLARVRGHVDADTVVVDAGAGTGRLALALAAEVREVVAVDSSAGMLGVLREHARANGVTNVRTVQAPMEEVGELAGDVVICAHVLPVVADARAFLAALDQVARRRVVVHLSVGNSDLRTDPLWRYFHGVPRPPMPTYLDAVAVLGELGIHPVVEVVEVASARSYASVAEAVDDHLDLLRLDDTDEMRAALDDVLNTWLVPADGGGWRTPVPTLPTALLSWIPASRPHPP